MDKIDVLKLLESKELLDSTGLEELEHLLIEEPYNPLLKRLVYEKKKLIGIPLTEFEWAEMSVLQPDFEHFFVDVANFETPTIQDSRSETIASTEEGEKIDDEQEDLSTTKVFESEPISIEYSEEISDVEETIDSYIEEYDKPIDDTLEQTTRAVELHTDLLLEGIEVDENIEGFVQEDDESKEDTEKEEFHTIAVQSDLLPDEVEVDETVEFQDEDEDEQDPIQKTLDSDHPVTETETGLYDKVLVGMKYDETDVEDWTDGEGDGEIVMIEIEEDEEIAFEEEDSSEEDEFDTTTYELSTDNPIKPFVSWMKSLNATSKETEPLKATVSDKKAKKAKKKDTKYKVKDKDKFKKKKGKSKTSKIDDKEGKKVKVKKVHKIKVDKRLAAVIDFANRSLFDSTDVGSETLAQVLVEQGYFSKAIDMYLRLSLAFPEKSAYFAEIIKKIQKTNK